MESGEVGRVCDLGETGEKGWIVLVQRGHPTKKPRDRREQSFPPTPPTPKIRRRHREVEVCAVGALLQNRLGNGIANRGKEKGRKKKGATLLEGQGDVLGTKE